MSADVKGIVPTGAIRYNTDSNKMECFNGTKWYQVAVSSYNLGNSTNSDNHGGARGLIGGGYGGPASPYHITEIQYINISSTGNAADFGDRTQNGAGGAFSSATRGVMGGGWAPTYVNTVDYITMASTGDAVNFGDKTTLAARMGGISNSTRGCFSGGFKAPAALNTIDFCTIASTGDFKDFGDLTTNKENPSGNINSPTRGFWAGGDQAGDGTEAPSIDKVTIATTGNAISFGDLSKTSTGGTGTSSATRGIYAGGYKPSPTSSTISDIQYINMSSEGNAAYFGDLTNHSKYNMGGVSDCVRGVFMGGHPTSVNIITYINIPTQGNGVDFGDLNTGCTTDDGMSTGHGGL